MPRRNIKGSGSYFLSKTKIIDPGPFNFAVNLGKSALAPRIANRRHLSLASFADKLNLINLDGNYSVDGSVASAGCRFTNKLHKFV
jgi:hypothetical protein